MNKKEIMDMLDQFECGIFADRKNMAEATEFGVMLLKASSPDERAMSAYTAIGVCQNTMVKVLKQMVEAHYDGDANLDTPEGDGVAGE